MRPGGRAISVPPFGLRGLKARGVFWGIRRTRRQVNFDGARARLVVLVVASQACAARTRSVHSKPDGKTDEQAGWAELCRCEPETKEEVAERRSTPKAAVGLCSTCEAANRGDSKEALAAHVKQSPIEEAEPNGGQRVPLAVGASDDSTGDRRERCFPARTLENYRERRSN